jgi:hypothetical protein
MQLQGASLLSSSSDTACGTARALPEVTSVALGVSVSLVCLCVRLLAIALQVVSSLCIAYFDQSMLQQVQGARADRLCHPNVQAHRCPFLAVVQCLTDHTYAWSSLLLLQILHLVAGW